MTNKQELLKQLEIEKQRRGIGRGTASMVADPEVQSLLTSEHRYAWEYELDAYRSQQKAFKWLVLGAICGALSLVLEVGFHWGSIMGLAKLWA